MTKEKNLPPLLRFAPSPTGYLHIGHAASAFFTWDQAGRSAEHFLLRIEDIDQTRCRPVFEAAIYEDLNWLGLSWEKPPRRQSEHFADYQSVLDQLEEMGLIYPCFCTRREIQEEIARSPSAPHGPEGSLYPELCKKLGQDERSERMARGDAYALRLDLAAARRRCPDRLTWFDRACGEQIATPEILGDVILARKDTPASYHLCVTHDDAGQGITLVTRGKDLFHATHLHRLLQEILGYPVPEYHHHPLLLDQNGVRFAKRNNSVTLRSLRERGFSPAQLRSIMKDQRISRLYDPV